MRRTPLIAALLLASSAASAQVYGGDCRSDTISGLARCAAERAQAPAEETAPSVPDVGEVAPLNPRRVQPSNLGGALQPSNLRTNPPVVGRADRPARAAETVPFGVERFDPLGGLSDDPGSPLYGLGRTSVDRRRALDPLAGTGIGADR